MVNQVTIFHRLRLILLVLLLINMLVPEFVPILARRLPLLVMTLLVIPTLLTDLDFADEFAKTSSTFPTAQKPLMPESQYEQNEKLTCWWIGSLILSLCY